ncbi:hypothetical protein M4951_10295 [Blastopirellula sp. J2-11]|uniref:hypothetical protein n=1 Tax=Blastopirellula sp. J2-11 TaxID=2943192 RepID=UPI0021C7639B|nr:hypothetical protein [Blastopirellula sp. J2-11]UUO08688.1 hypothetical protein M4951_10295 [Blastopirellula sp. J2-11]
MAIIFELFVEVADESHTESMIAFWNGFATTLSDGTTISWDVTTHSPKQVVLWSKSLGLTGIKSFEHATQLSECGIAFAKRLMDTPDFEFARIGIEVDGYSRDDFVQESEEFGEPWVPEGTIISESLWRDIGKPTNLSRFRDGYYWNKYLGESVNPVFLDPSLYELWRQLPS